MAFQNFGPYSIPFCAAPALNSADALFEFFVGTQQSAPEVIEPRRDVVCGFVPALRTGFPRFVVTFF